MRRFVDLVPLVPLALAITGCSLDTASGGDCGPEPADQCPSEECGVSCNSDEYACLDGEWQVVAACDACLGGLPAVPGRWVWSQTLTTTTCAAPVEIRVIVGLDVWRWEGEPYRYAGFTADDADLVIGDNLGLPGIGPDYCTETVDAAFTDVWRIDGAPAPVAGSYALDLTGPGLHGFTPSSLEGSFEATIDGCTVTGELAGTWVSTPP